MERLYQTLFEQHLADYRQMIFVMGPRQVGKTTVAQKMVAQHTHGFYFNWDNINDREQIIAGPNNIAKIINLPLLSNTKPLIVFDEIHKFKNWRDFLKGFYDSYPNKCNILVTGSAQLDVFNRGGDSLMGRYFPFRFHPLSIAEITQRGINTTREYWEIPKLISNEHFEALWNFGGYPDPYLKQSAAFSRRWIKLRGQQLFSEDIRDLTRIQDIDTLEILAEKLKQHVGSLTSFQNLATQLRVSDNTIRNWLETLKALYYCFEIKPWSKNVSRSLLKEPKYYLWDWTLCPNEGMKAENMVALHLLKAINFWNDIGLGDYGLHFIRDKEKREVDFLITKNNQPWILVEVKLSLNKSISSSLHHFHEQLKPNFTFQVVCNMEYVQKNCFDQPGLHIVPLKTFLSQLV
ncbi:MAG: ATP-binding protein [Legionella sp.]|nr:ATP-binding protein [Legionella sp.]